MPKIYKQSCNYCGKYYKKQNKKFCSMNCFNYFRNKNNVVKKCINCKKIICRKSKYRCKQCARIGKNNAMFGKHRSNFVKEKIRKKLLGRKNPHKDNCLCVFCKAKMGEYRGKNNFCWKGGDAYCMDCGHKTSARLCKRCRNCYDKSKFREGNPNWKNGISFEPYSLEFTEELKKQIRQRDNFICQKCFKSQEQELQELNCNLDNHHINYDKKNCNKDNLITLCRSCNAKVNFNRNYWILYFTNLIDLLDWT